ncbi:hypothetical protein A2837_02360 [Candidatus Kaiserbacteria bacterium RIFCSPHIGHO2_01_FULL_46_22]|uniref:Uncharacterized protein n=1 Tax=Candidatus Kaiserbacteria bacterium RIFCSPHIGHO2_01_FULL_46_22 TaxID=1798475 RepID=A0A1F6BWN6_9BACT|nr:MAG: hypothetical protein A2837_02360 [Candidatus Kaiserbacteria bacterium RIFCSPHIGHO2_01_FULL_46_22]
MRFQAGTQIVLIVISIVIVFTVVKPKFSEIAYQQNEMVTYRTALDNIGRYNQRLQTLLNQAKAMSEPERENLFRYLPEEIDAVVVGRDIANMADSNNLLLLDVEPGTLAAVTTVVPEQGAAPESGTDTGMVAPPSEDGETAKSTGMYSQKFKVGVVGNYEDMKSFLKDLERNAYPLRLLELDFTIEETDNSLLEYSLVLETYTLKGN